MSYNLIRMDEDDNVDVLISSCDRDEFIKATNQYMLWYLRKNNTDYFYPCMFEEFKNVLHEVVLYCIKENYDMLETLEYDSKECFFFSRKEQKFGKSTNYILENYKPVESIGEMYNVRTQHYNLKCYERLKTVSEHIKDIKNMNDKELNDYVVMLEEFEKTSLNKEELNLEDFEKNYTFEDHDISDEWNEFKEEFNITHIVVDE